MNILQQMEQLYTKSQTLTIGVALGPFLFVGHQYFFGQRKTPTQRIYPAETVCVYFWNQTSRLQSL